MKVFGVEARQAILCGNGCCATRLNFISLFSVINPKFHYNLYQRVVEIAEMGQRKPFITSGWPLKGFGRGQKACLVIRDWHVGRAMERTGASERLSLATKKHDEDFELSSWIEFRYRRSFPVSRMHGRVSKIKRASPPVCSAENPS